jgi:hypothetical protein
MMSSLPLSGRGQRQRQAGSSRRSARTVFRNKQGRPLSLGLCMCTWFANLQLSCAQYHNPNPKTSRAPDSTRRGLYDNLCEWARSGAVEAVFCCSYFWSLRIFTARAGAKCDQRPARPADQFISGLRLDSIARDAGRKAYGRRASLICLLDRGTGASGMVCSRLPSARRRQFHHCSAKNGYETDYSVRSRHPIIPCFRH